MRYGLPQSVQKKSRHYLKEDENGACVCLSPQERTFEKHTYGFFRAPFFGGGKSAARQARSVRQIACSFESLRGCSAFSRRDGYRSGYGCRLRRQNHRRTQGRKAGFRHTERTVGRTRFTRACASCAEGGKRRLCEKAGCCFFPLRTNG